MSSFWLNSADQWIAGIDTINRLSGVLCRYTSASLFPDKFIFSYEVIITSLISVLYADNVSITGLNGEGEVLHNRVIVKKYLK